MVVEHSETGPESFGIGLCRFAGTAPGNFGLVSSGLVTGLGPKSTIAGQILKSSPGTPRPSNGSNLVPFATQTHMLFLAGKH